MRPCINILINFSKKYALIFLLILVIPSCLSKKPTTGGTQSSTNEMLAERVFEACKSVHTRRIYGAAPLAPGSPSVDLRHTIHLISKTSSHGMALRNPSRKQTNEP